MREIEFRVWDSRKKSYFNKKDISIDNLGNIFVFEGYDENDADLWHVRILSDPDNERYVIEQTTGLTDKNGTEIYEGNICSFTSKTGKYVGAVKWTGNLASFGLRMVKNNFRYTFSDLDTMGVNLDTLEVIGNIHENPELMEEK